MCLRVVTGAAEGGAVQDTSVLHLLAGAAEGEPVQDMSLCTCLQALQKAGLCGPHSCTRLLVLSPRTLADVLDSILEV